MALSEGLRNVTAHKPKERVDGELQYTNLILTNIKSVFGTSPCLFSLLISQQPDKIHGILSLCLFSFIC